MTRLSDAIEALYRAFADVPKPTHIDGCPHCLDHKEIGTLLGKPLREVAPSELTPYACSAFLTVGDRADYLYFLPRILEVSVTEPGWWPDPEVTGRAIRSAGPATWTQAQRAALDAYLAALVDTIVGEGPHDRLDPWVCAIGRAGLDVRPVLARVEASPAAVRAFYEANAAELANGRLANAFWEPPCPAHDAVVAWFASRMPAGLGRSVER
jgi:hypothetical protein